MVAKEQHEAMVWNRVQRVGLIEERGLLVDRFILAARIADQAAGGQILVSALLKEMTRGTGEFSFDQCTS